MAAAQRAATGMYRRVRAKETLTLYLPILAAGPARCGALPTVLYSVWGQGRGRGQRSGRRAAVNKLTDKRPRGPRTRNIRHMDSPA